MNTNSEIMTLIESSKIFLPSFCHMGIKVRKNKQQKELCDCLIEFKDYYIVIQIKERNSNTGNDNSWYEKKVLKNAKSQIRDTIEFINDKENIFYENDKMIEIDRNKVIVPLIVFDNERIKDYKRVIYSDSLSMKINMFNIKDFKTMLSTIKIPFDIINYLEFREMLFYNPSLMNGLVFDDANNQEVIINKIYNEKDFSSHYLLRTYTKDLASLQYLDFFNLIINEVDRINDPKKYKLLEMLLSCDHLGAKKISDMLLTCFNRCGSDDIYSPDALILNNHAILFYSYNGKYSEVEYFNFIKNYTKLFASQYDIDNISVLVGKKVNDKHAIDFRFAELETRKSNKKDKNIKRL